MKIKARIATGLIATSLLVAGVAVAQDDAPAFAPELVPDVSGSWTFKTGPYNRSCHIRGRMFLSPKDETGHRSCEFVTFEECPGLSAEVRQTCTARHEGDQLIIRSEILSIDRQEPQAYGYAPDSWNLVIRSSQEMTGTLESASRAQAIFTREEIPIS